MRDVIRRERKDQRSIVVIATRKVAISRWLGKETAAT